jgi:hypothetical protein
MFSKSQQTVEPTRPRVSPYVRIKPTLGLRHLIAITAFPAELHTIPAFAAEHHNTGFSSCWLRMRA